MGVDSAMSWQADALRRRVLAEAAAASLLLPSGGLLNGEGRRTLEALMTPAEELAAEADDRGGASPNDPEMQALRLEVVVKAAQAIGIPTVIAALAGAAEAQYSVAGRESDPVRDEIAGPEGA